MRLTSVPVVALLAALACGSAGAQSSEDEEILETVPVREGTDSAPPPEDDLDDQVFYSGLGVMRAETDFSNIGEAVNLELVLGFRIPTVKWFGIEIDIGQTIIPGENERANPNTPSSNCDPIDEALGLCTPGGSQPATRDRDELQMQALGLSAVLKSTGRFYVMGRYGYRYIATSIDELNENRSGTGYGAGVGYRWGTGLSGVELTYKELSEEVEAVGLVFYARFNDRR